MEPINIYVDETGNFFLQGTLTFTSINNKTVNAFSVQIPDATNKIILDLKQVTAFDSAGLALLIEWIRLAENRNIKLQFANIPDQLLAIARLGGLERVLVTCNSQS